VLHPTKLSSTCIVVVSNLHNPHEMTNVTMRTRSREKEAVPCPESIYTCSTDMEGVDHFDNLHVHVDGMRPHL
jgi:hypothetical protein